MLSGLIKYFVGLFLIQYNKIAINKKVSLDCCLNKTMFREEYNNNIIQDNKSIYENDWTEGEVTWDNIYKHQAEQELHGKPNVYYLIHEFAQ